MGLLDLNGSWKPSLEFLLEHMKQPRRKRLKLVSFPRGLDGARIDVWLGDELNQAIEQLVEASLAKRMQMLKIGGAPVLGSSDVSGHFRESYGAASLATARQARRAMRREIYQLFHLAVVKQMLLVLDRQLVHWAEESEGGLNAGSLPADGVGSRPERVWQFRRHRKRLRFLVARDVLGILHSLDRVARKRRKSILAISWPVAEEVLFNPLLQIGDLGCEENFLELYPLVLIKAPRFNRMDRVVLDELSPWLPECHVGAPPPLEPKALKSLPLRQDQGELAGYAQVEAFLRQVMSPGEYLEGKGSWLDDPRNLVRLFGGGSQGDRSGPWHHSRWPLFREELLERIERRLAQEGLLDSLLASERLRKAWSDLGRRGPPRLLLEHLLGVRSWKDVAGALEKLEEVPNLRSYRSRLEQARKELRQAPAARRRRWLIQALEGHARLRRDLKLAWEAYRAMDCFRMLDGAEDLQLSRVNGLLQDFTPGAEEPEAIRGHVIIKADLRGSTELIAGMNRMGINPATYFSRNLFGPVNTLLNTFGAEKVFLEGDAVILAMRDVAGRPEPVVARACGLAHELISLVSKRNRENRQEGLPQLELGVGIAYEAGPPTYLFDEGRRITISPAIHRADRLSSSNISRDFLARTGLDKPDGWGVEVMILEESANPVAKGGELRRYNVNGVELDVAAFDHLGSEMALKVVPAELAGGAAGDRYHLGRYPDDTGKVQWLVVREAVARHWDGRRLKAGEDAPRFHEVVTAPALVKMIRHLAVGKT